MISGMRFLRGVMACLLLLSGALLAAEPPSLFTSSRVLESAQQQGVLRVGVKTDFAPFGMLDEEGRPIGFEVDLAAALAEELGLELRLVGVTTENRFQRLEQGRVDVLIATAADTRERRQIATAIEPNYYGGGVAVLLRPELQVSDWQELRGKTLCALQGAYFNKPMTQRYILRLQSYRSVRDALLALRDGRCSGFLYTDLAILQYLKSPEWEAYKSPLPSALVVPWALSIARSERGAEFERMLGDIVAGWHREGRLIGLERRWGLPPSHFLQESAALWKLRKASGEYVCTRGEDGVWPTNCRNAAFVGSKEVEGLQGLGLWVKETLGFDFSLIYAPYDRARYVQGIAWTLLLCAGSIVGSLALGLFGAAVIFARIPVFSALLKGFGNFGRMTPMLLQMYLVFFSLSGIVWALFGISLPPVLVALACLALYHGSIMAFAFLDAAAHLQEKRPDFRFSRSALPQLLQTAAVGVRNTLTNLVKATTIASAIAVPELLSATIAIIAERGNVFVMMNALLLVFYLMTVFWILLFERFERWLARMEPAR